MKRSQYELYISFMTHCDSLQNSSMDNCHITQVWKIVIKLKYGKLSCNSSMENCHKTQVWKIVMQLKYG